MLAEESHGPSEVPCLVMKGKGPKICRTHGPTFHSPIIGKDLTDGQSSGKDAGLENNVPKVMGMSSKSAINGPG